MKKQLLAIFLAISFFVTSLNAIEVSLEEKITGLYVAFFNRAADESGLNYWKAQGENAEANGNNVSNILKQLSKGFATHPTFTSAYSSMGTENFVNAIYVNSLGKNGDAEGVAYWSGLINSGKSRSDMVAEFIELSLTLDLTAENFPNLSQIDLDNAIARQSLIYNKVSVAVYFTNSLGSSTNVIDSANPENDSAYLASIKVLSEVTIDIVTVTAATGRILNLLNGGSTAIDLIINDWENIDSESLYETTLPRAGVNAGACTGCHGADWSKKALGKSLDVSQMTHYDIATALIGYKNGTYGGSMKGLMKGQVAKYSDADLEAFAQTIGQESGNASIQAPISTTSVNAGACTGCHGADWSKKALGKSLDVSQMTHYNIATALIGYKNGTYGGSMKGLMKGQVAKYSDADLEAFAQTIGK